MTFVETPLAGAFVVELEPIHDERGFFARAWCEREFAEHDLKARWVQSNISFNKTAGTLRGLHYQAPPHAEAKLVRCTRGSVYDVIVDLRRGSRTFKQHWAVKLTLENRRMLYIPEHFAHGFLTLRDETEVFYQMSDAYEPSCTRGIRWNDPGLRISWPGEIRVISEKDRNYADFSG